MALSAEQQKQLDELTKLSKEPEGPPQGVNFTLDLSSDTAWERAKHLGLVKDPEPPSDNGDGDGDGDDVPIRPGYFGKK